MFDKSCGVKFHKADPNNSSFPAIYSGKIGTQFLYDLDRVVAVQRGHDVYAESRLNASSNSNL
jgi:hypothetical protein